MRFDAALKFLFERYPQDLPRLLLGRLGVRVPSVQIIDADLATVSAAGDKVFRVGGRRPWLFHLELQASHDPGLARRLLLYNVLLGHRHGLPVRTAVLLLRPEASRRGLAGTLALDGPDGRPYLSFRYDVFRLWELPPQALLGGGLGVLPLAPLADVPAEQVPGVIERMKRRVESEAAAAEAADLWAGALVLLGLRFEQAVAAQLVRGVRSMKESTTYQAILAEGEARGKAEGAVEEARRLLLLLGERRYGPPDPRARAAVEALTDLKRLEELIGKLSDTAAWDDLLPAAGTSRRRR